MCKKCGCQKKKECKSQCVVCAPVSRRVLTTIAANAVKEYINAQTSGNSFLVKPFALITASATSGANSSNGFPGTGALSFY
jgi:hypothetical protein